jgi:hypothetical protein
LNKAVIDGEYLAAFRKIKLDAFDKQYDKTTEKTDNGIKTYYLEGEEVTEIPLRTAFKYHYLKPFLLFIKNRFIFWNCITFIHSKESNYLRILDTNGYCNRNWTKRIEEPNPDWFGEERFDKSVREAIINSHIGKSDYEQIKEKYDPVSYVYDEETHISKSNGEYVTTVGHDAYYITNDDINMVFVPMDLEYYDDFDNLNTATYNIIKNRCELCFDIRGYLVPDINDETQESRAYMYPSIGDEYVITSSWNKDDSLQTYLNNGKRLHMRDLITFKYNEDSGNYELYPVRDGEVGDDYIDTVEELVTLESNNKCMYALIHMKDMVYPISLKDEFISKSSVDSKFNETLSIPLAERRSYTNIIKLIKEYNMNLLRSENKDVVTTYYEFNKSDLVNNRLFLSNCVSDSYETYPMIFCDGKLISNYHTIEYKMDGVYLYFTNEDIDKYNLKTFEIVFFNRVNNEPAIYRGVQKMSEIKNGLDIADTTDIDNLKLFTHRADQESYPEVTKDERNQYNVKYRVFSEDREYPVVDFKLNNDGTEESFIKNVTLESKYIKLFNENDYMRKISFVSDRQFRYNYTYLNYSKTEKEFSIELTSDFKYCRDTNRFMVFYNGRLLEYYRYYFVFPEPETPVNTTSVYLKINKIDWTSDKNIVEVFYVPNRLSSVNCIMQKSTYIDNTTGLQEEGYGYIECDKEYESDLLYPIANDLCFIFKNGLKIEAKDIYNLGTRRVAIPKLHKIGTESEPVSYIVLRHSEDVNDEYIKSIESDGCKYEDLLEDNEVIDGFFYKKDGKLVYPDADRYSDNTVLTANIGEVVTDNEIYNKILIDYYLQPGTGIDRYTIPVNMNILSSKFKIKGSSGDMILYPSTGENE